MTMQAHPAADSAAAQALRARTGKPKGPTHPAALPPVPTVTPAPGLVTRPDVPPKAAEGVELIHIHSLFASPLNPRKSFPETEIAELADSIAESGLLQPLTARDAGDQFGPAANPREVYIGGRRLRALQKLEAEGRWPFAKLPNFLVPVIRRDVDDLELLQVAVAENVNRKDMHPLEEGQAFVELRRRGRSLDEIAQTYGKGRRWVEQRIQVATDLDDKAKDLFQAGKINMEAARVLVRLPEAERKGVVTAIAKGDAGYENAAAIKARVAEGLPEVNKALFDVSLYTGEYEIGGRYTATKRFSDIAQFRTLQQAAIDAKREDLRGKWAFVETLQVKDAGSFTAGEHGFDRMWEAADPAQHGALIGIGPDLSVRILEGVCRGKAPARAVAPTAAAQKATDPVAAIGAGRREYAHKAKSQVLQSAVFARGHRAALEMAIMAMLGDHSMVGLKTDSPSFDARAVAPDLVARMEAWRKRLGVSAFDHIDPTVRTGTTYLQFEGGWAPNNTKRLGVFERLAEISEDDLRDLFDTLVAARCISMAVYGMTVSLGDQPIAIAAAKRYGADMAKHWQIDADYLAKLQADDLHLLAARLNLWIGVNQPKNHNTLSLGDLQRMKVVDRRATILDFVVANDVRYVPPELEITDQKTIEKALRSTYKPKAPEPVQLDLVDAVAATATKREKLAAGLQDLFDDATPATARLLWVKAATLAHKQLVTDVAAALPQHPAFGEKELYLNAGTARLLLDQSTAAPGDYYVIGIEGRHGYETPDEVAAVMSQWLQELWLSTMRPTPAPEPAEQPVDQAAEADAAIDQLFDDTAVEEEEAAEEEARGIIAFVRAPYCELPNELLDSLSDALPRHPAYSNDIIRITAADATITLTCETVEDPDGGDPDSYILTGYLDDTLLRDKEPLPGPRCAEVITAWMESLTAGAQ